MVQDLAHAINHGKQHDGNTITIPSLQKPLRFQNIILDLGDVLCLKVAWKMVATPIKLFDLQHILNSAIWHDYERGKIGQEQCYQQTEEMFNLSPGSLPQTLSILQSKLSWNLELVEYFKALKDETDGQMRFFLMSNISKSHFELFRPTIEKWNLFDAVFPSSCAGFRKPDPEFYDYVLREADIRGEPTIIIDDKAENTTPAVMLGLHRILYTSNEQMMQDCAMLFGNPILRAEQWLDDHARNMWSVTNTGVTIYDQFNQLAIWHGCDDRNKVCLNENACRTWNTFLGKPVLTTETLPDDLDATSMALLIVPTPDSLKHEVMDEMLTYMLPNGLFLTYFDTNRPRPEPYLSGNVVRLFFANGRGHQVVQTIDYLTRYLETYAYKDGSRYYDHPEWFFYLLSDLCANHVSDESLGRLRMVLSKHVRERIGTTHDSASAAWRLVASQNLGIENIHDLKTLLMNQQSDGSWSKEPWIYNYGRSGILVGNTGLITTFAVKAIKHAGEKNVKEAIQRV